MKGPTAVALAVLLLALPSIASAGADASACHGDSLCSDAVALSFLQLTKDVHGTRLNQAGDTVVGVHTRKENIWIGKNGDAMRTGWSPNRAPFELEAGSNWSWIPNGRVVATPLIDAESNLYFTVANPPEVRKYSKEGQLIWSHQEPEATFPAVPSLAENKIVVGLTNGVVLAIDINSGKEVWRKQVGLSAGGDTASMTVVDGLAVAAVTKGDGSGGGNNCLVALDLQTGDTRWEHMVEPTMFNALLDASEGSLFFADSNGAPQRLNLSDGTVIWKGTDSPQAAFSTGGAVLGPNNVLYVTGNEVGKLPIPATLGSALGLPSTQSGYVAAYAVEDGRQLWKQRTAGALAANAGAAVGPLTPGGPLAVVFATGDNPDMAVSPIHFSKGRKVQAVSAATGDLIWTYDMPDYTKGVAAGDDKVAPNMICLPDSWSNPAIGADGTSYLGNEDGRIYALKDLNGDGHITGGEVSSLDVHFAFQGSPAIAPGLLAVASCGSFHVFLSP